MFCDRYTSTSVRIRRILPASFVPLGVKTQTATLFALEATMYSNIENLVLRGSILYQYPPGGIITSVRKAYSGDLLE
jgi:hypothetical protein